jgi:hypothetical protein
VSLANFVCELTDCDNLAHAGGGVGDEVEDLGEDANSSDERNPKIEPEVFLERLLGVHRHGE